MKKENIKTIILGIFIIAVILFSNYLGYIRAINNNNLVNRKYFQEIDNTDMLGNEIEYSITFYATITEEKNNSFIVKGLEVNDISYRGDFSFGIQSETRITWHNQEIDMSELEEGDNISITFLGPIQESSPATINNVIEIKILDDEL